MSIQEVRVKPGMSHCSECEFDLATSCSTQKYGCYLSGNCTPDEVTGRGKFSDASYLILLSLGGYFMDSDGDVHQIVLQTVPINAQHHILPVTVKVHNVSQQDDHNLTCYQLASR